MKRLLFIGSLIALIAPLSVGAYGVETHAALTQEIGRFFNLHYPKRALTIAEIKLLMQAAIDEDDGLRMLNHFYDPIHKTGLVGKNPLTGITLVKGLPSKEWAQNSLAQAGLVNNALALVIDQDKLDSSDFAWRRAIEDYARGSKERGLEGLGHVLHLIEDLTVPAHVRNDPHPPAKTVGKELGDDDPYEHWSHKFTRYNTDVIGRMRDKKPIDGLGSLNKYFDELAKYTNTKFLSKDTIGIANFELPNIDVLEAQKINRINFLKNDQGAIIAAKFSQIADSADIKATTDNDIVSQSTWDHLSVKAVQYGAGVIDLFFDEVEKLKADPNFNPAPQRSLLGQLIDSVGENVQALLEGPPDTQPEVIIKSVAEPEAVPDESKVEDEPVQSEPEEAQDEIVVPESVITPAPHAASVSSGSSSGEDDEVAPEESAEIEPEPVIEEPEEEEDVEESPVEQPVETPDTTPPLAVSDLSVQAISADVLVLNWTAPSDTESKVTGYEMRYSVAAITDENWSAATLVSGLGTPQAAGVGEEYELTGLNASMEYFVGIKSQDAAGNWSALSNIVSVQTGLGVPNHLVIGEIATNLPAFGEIQQFVELYNPTNVAISLNGYSLQYLAGSAPDLSQLKKIDLNSGAVVAAKSFYLLQTKYPGGVQKADEHWREALSATGGTVFLVSDRSLITGGDDEQIIDKVAYGAGSLLSPEGSVTLAPATWQSIERRALSSGSCIAPSGGAQFVGNGCDSNNNAFDFGISAGVNIQKRTHLPEPRNVPAPVAAIAAYDPLTRQISFTWNASTDALGSSAGITYRVTDINTAESPVVLSQKPELAYVAQAGSVGTDFKATIEAVDKDGRASAKTNISVAVPSYLSEVRFIETSNASGAPAYSARLAWSSYPFIPTGSKWHLVVFYYNEDAKTLGTLGRLNSGHNWGIGVSMPSTFKTTYPNCQAGNTNTASALILPDTAADCSHLLTQPLGSAIDFGLLRDGFIELPVLPQTYGADTPEVGEDFITLAFYAFNSANPFGSDMQLVAVDKTRYYLSADDASDEGD